MLDRKAVQTIVFLLLLLLASVTDLKKRIGGGDIKLMAAAGLVLGLPAGIFATILGLLLVLAYSVFLKICKKTQVIAVPLVPFLSAGCAAGYLIG